MRQLHLPATGPEYHGRPFGEKQGIFSTENDNEILSQGITRAGDFFQMNIVYRQSAAVARTFDGDDLRKRRAPVIKSGTIRQEIYLPGCQTMGLSALALWPVSRVI